MREFLLLTAIAALTACGSTLEAPPAPIQDFSIAGRESAACVTTGFQPGSAGYDACVVREAGKMQQ